MGNLRNVVLIVDVKDNSEEATVKLTLRFVLACTPCRLFLAATRAVDIHSLIEAADMRSLQTAT